MGLQARSLRRHPLQRRPARLTAASCVTFSSDSPELARRLNLEAAKAVKYGGLEEEEALACVTSNAASQLDLGERIGSLEPGKDADLVVWSGHPLSVYSIAEKTWVDGVREFDREADLAGRAAVEAAASRADRRDPRRHG